MHQVIDGLTDASLDGEARRPVRARRLQELDDAGARDVAAEALLDVDLGERRLRRQRIEQINLAADGSWATVIVTAWNRV